jgi:hypothetical protein
LRNKTCGRAGTQFKDEGSAEISKEATSEVKKEEPIPKKFEEVHIKTRTTPSVDFAEPIKTNKRSMSSAKPLREFEHMD